MEMQVGKKYSYFVASPCLAPSRSEHRFGMCLHTARSVEAARLHCWSSPLLLGSAPRMFGVVSFHGVETEVVAEERLGLVVDTLYTIVGLLLNMSCRVGHNPDVDTTLQFLHL